MCIQPAYLLGTEFGRPVTYDFMNIGFDNFSLVAHFKVNVNVFFL